MSVLLEKIYRYDSIISYRFCDLRSKQWIAGVMIIASKLGDGPLWVLAAMLLVALGGEEGRYAAFMGAVSALVCIIIFKLLKNATSRKRPFETYPDLTIDLKLPPPDMFSFPSGHSMNAFALTAVVGYYFPFALIPLLIAALLIGASRVFLALHYPSDVAAGACVGVTVSAVLIRFIG